MSKRYIASAVLGLAMVFAVTAAPAKAQTIAELQALVNQLMAQIAALQGGTTVTTGVAFTQNLTIGSTGPEVVALQQMLVAQGHLVMPAGVAYGYFGSLTKTAVAKWQAANGVMPAAGYWGAISRARAAALGMGAGTTTGGTVTTPGSQTGITTPGVEGTLTASLASTPTGVKLYEGESKKSVMGIELEAKLSDVRVERIKIDLGTSTDIYRKIASRLYIMDGSTVLASVDLNSDTVIKEGSNYYVTVTGLNFIVSKNTKKTVQIALDAMNTWDSDYDGDSWTLEVEADGIRGVDGAGINLYNSSPASRSFTTEAELISDAALKVSLNVNTPKTAEVVASNGSDNDELDGLEVLRFDVKAEKDAVTIVDLTATTTLTGAADLVTIYLMDGNTVLGSESGPTTAGTSAVTFEDIDYTISRDSTKTLSIKVDIQNADGTASTIVTSVLASGMVAENSVGDTLAVGVTTGSATGNTLTVRDVGAEISLVSKTALTYTPASAVAGATSSANTTFTIRIKAVGGDIYVGPQASSTFAMQTYKNGVATTLLVASSTSWTIPSGVSTSGAGITSGGFKLTDGQSVDIPVDFFFQGRTTAGVLIDAASYAVGLTSVKWSTDGSTESTSTFMAGETAWRTNAIVMP